MYGWNHNLYGCASESVSCESCLNIKIVVKIDSTGTENGSVTCTRSEYEGRKLGVTWTKEIDDTDRVCTKQEPQTC